MTDADTWAENADPVFVVGLPRSGTTVMGRTLIESPGFWRLDSPLETRAFQDGFLAAPTLSRAASRYLGSRLDAFLAARSTLSGRDLARRFFYEASLHYGVGRVIEKTPHHLLTLQAMFDAFPRATVLVMLRSARETVISRRLRLHREREAGASEEQLQWLSAPIEHLLGVFDTFDRAAANAFEKWPGAVHAVSYQRLSEDPLTELAAVGQHLRMSKADTAEMIHRALQPRPVRHGGVDGPDRKALGLPIGVIERPPNVLTDAEEAALAAHRFICLPA